MKPTRPSAAQTFLLVLLGQAAFLAAVYFLAAEPLGAALWPLAAVAAVVTLLVWGALQWRLGTAAPASAPAPAAEPRPAAPPPPAPPSDEAALHLLAIFQRKGRLIDFLHEDLSAYQDAQIGAAVRSVHAGCKQALDEYVALEPVYAEAEGATVTIPAGFDAHAVRLTGNVAGDPPFKGALRHRGWRVAKVTLPARTGTPEAARVVAPAEVEVG
ncbi:MAG: DUF2760 domain-containing protein [Rhodothermales bacterium]|nr:DUF2760 domain-containing protein [Rhodothermales bacterium]